MPDDAPTPRCGAKTRQGGVCGQRAGARTSHEGDGKCWLHGGASPSGTIAANREGLERRAASMATAVRMEPLDALLHVVYAQAGRVQWIGGMLEGVDESALFSDDGRMDGVAMAHRQELRQLAQVSKMALDAGVAERRVQMAERTAALIAAAAEDAFAEVGEVATPALRAAFARTFAARLSVLEAQAGDEQLALGA